jgi:uncharacterized protein YccT (UPF0319 family)
VVKHETPQIENNPNAHHWLKKKKWHICTMEYYKIMKKNELLIQQKGKSVRPNVEQNKPGIE